MKSTLLLCALAFSLTRTHAADDPGFVPMFNGLDLRGWKVPTSAEARWKPSNWNLKLEATDAQASTPLWSAAELANGEFIADFQLSKTADLSKPCTGICVRGQNNPAVLIGTGQAPIVFGPDQVKPGKWYRLRLKLDGKQATATLTETHEANPQTMEATLEAPAKGPIALADLGTPVTFANFFLRE